MAPTLRPAADGEPGRPEERGEVRREWFGGAGDELRAAALQPDLVEGLAVGAGAGDGEEDALVAGGGAAVGGVADDDGIAVGAALMDELRRADDMPSYLRTLAVQLVAEIDGGEAIGDGRRPSAWLPCAGSLFTSLWATGSLFTSLWATVDRYARGLRARA